MIKQVFFLFSILLIFFADRMPKLITDYLKRSRPSPLATKESTAPPTLEISASCSSSKLTDAQTRETLSPNENIESIPIQCKPGPEYSFPQKQFGNKKRSCQSSWFKDYTWLHYSEEKDSVFCIFCMKHERKLTAEHNMEDTYIRRGFSNWKKAPKAFKNHESSNAHRAAVTYESVVPQCGDVLEMTINDLNKKRLAERRYLIKIMECIRFLARQGLAFRGDNGNDNLTQLFKLLNKDDQTALKRLDKESNLESGQHKYMHNDIQNELIELMAKQVLLKKLELIRSSKFFGIMADEYTDISNKELLSMCFRWIEDFKVHEDFIGYYELPDIKSDTIVTAIKDSLIRMQLSLNNLRAQAYDGASNMFGKNNGVAVQIAADQPKALATHCQGHSLNLGIKTTMTNSKEMKDTMGTVTEIISLVKYSPKRENLLGSIKDLIHFESLHTDEEVEVEANLDKLSVTRWTVRGNAYEKIELNYLPLMKLWDVSLAAGKLESEVKARIIGVQNQMCEFQFYYILCLSQRLFAISDNLSKTLQSESMSALSGFHLAELTVQTFEKMRSDERARLFFDTVSKKALAYPFILKPALPRKRKRPNYGILHNYFQVEGYSNDENSHHASTPEEYFRQQYFEILDLIISSIKDRFNQPAFTAFLKMEQLLLKIIHGDNYEDELKYVSRVYKDDINPAQVQTEAFCLSTIFQDIDCENFSDVLKHLESLDKIKFALIPNLLTIVHLILINPATSCTPERSFSVARRIKTWLRATMTTKRFNNLAILSVHKELTDQMDFIDIGNEFVSKYDERKINLGKFVPGDVL